MTIQNTIQIKWEEQDLNLPEGIDIFLGTNKTIPIKAWVAKVNLNDPRISVRVLSSKDEDRKESSSQFIKNYKARLIVNGGFFNNQKNRAQHIGLLKTDGLLEEPASHSVIRDGERYFISRGAFGIKENGEVDIAWCSTRNDSIFQWEKPFKNRPGKPNNNIDFENSTFWRVKDAIHAGPVIISENKINITVEDEVFFNTSIAGVQPRTAVGYTIDNELILMVVDGRQIESRGVYLEELALLMRQFNCYEAINLDGGGSSTIVLGNLLLNRPAGLNYQREIMSSIGVFYN